MKVGIYTKCTENNVTLDIINPQIIDGLKWMYLNGFDSYAIYIETVEDELTDMTERVELNKLIHAANNRLIDAVFVSDINIFSPISLKALQAIISLQEEGMNVYHNNGCFEASDENIKVLKKQFENNWQRIHEITKEMNLGE